MMAIVILTGLILLIIAVLTLAKKYLKVDDHPLIEQVNLLLPQTQCAQCGYPGCKPYAKAIVENAEAINRCPPGGDNTIKALAQLLDKEILPLNPDNGVLAPQTIVKIRENECIGCTLCIQACPVDAILGGPRLMHTVITDLCTGCNLCLEPCPVDCIDILEAHHG